MGQNGSWTIFSNTYSQRSVTEVDTTGIHISPDKAVTITFHVLVPKAVWNWDQKSRICLHFGHWKLGGWRCDLGQFHEVRYVCFYQKRITIYVIIRSCYYVHKILTCTVQGSFYE